LGETVEFASLETFKMSAPASIPEHTDSPPTREFFWNKIETLSKMTAVFAGFVYAAGFFIVSIHLGSFDLFPTRHRERIIESDMQYNLARLRSLSFPGGVA
jgi:hypothetical protein